VLSDEDVLLRYSAISANKRILSSGLRINGPSTVKFLFVEFDEDIKVVLFPFIVIDNSYCLAIVPRLKSSPIECTITGSDFEKSMFRGLEPTMPASKSCSRML
jgi:hypothetical protein